MNEMCDIGAEMGKCMTKKNGIVGYEPLLDDLKTVSYTHLTLPTKLEV